MNRHERMLTATNMVNVQIKKTLVTSLPNQNAIVLICGAGIMIVLVILDYVRQLDDILYEMKTIGK